MSSNVNSLDYYERIIRRYYHEDIIGVFVSHRDVIAKLVIVCRENYDKKKVDEFINKYLVYGINWEIHTQEV